jgi:hypothetical protein
MLKIRTGPDGPAMIVLFLLFWFWFFLGHSLTSGPAFSKPVRAGRKLMVHAITALPVVFWGKQDKYLHFLF